MHARVRGEAERATVIRFATDGDLRFCKRFDSETPTPTLKAKIRANEAILAFKGREAIGYLRLEYLWSRFPYIGLVVVREGSRGKGTGEKMLRFLEGYLRENGSKKLFSSSQADAPRAQQWHRKMGFVECGIIVGINEGGVGEVFFQKSLRGAVPS